MSGIEAKCIDVPADGSSATTATSRPFGGRVVPAGARAWSRTLPSLQQQVRMILRRTNNSRDANPLQRYNANSSATCRYIHIDDYAKANGL
jgi:hypothetical protein